MKAGIERGDSVLVEYDEQGGMVMLKPPVKGKRKTWTLGAKLTVGQIEEGIERGSSM